MWPLSVARKLARTASLLIVPPIPLHGLFPSDIAKNGFLLLPDGHIYEI